MDEEKAVVKALREVLREELINRNTVEIEGLGQFENVHQKQKQKRESDGRIWMMPPCDLVTFRPETRGEG